MLPPIWSSIFDDGDVCSGCPIVARHLQADDATADYDGGVWNKVQVENLTIRQDEPFFSLHVNWGSVE